VTESPRLGTVTVVDMVVIVFRKMQIDKGSSRDRNRSATADKKPPNGRGVRREGIYTAFSDKIPDQRSPLETDPQTVNELSVVEIAVSISSAVK
jgi:hypothetical protein